METLQVHLTPKDKQMLRGDHGPATKMAMSILVRMADVSNAHGLIDITGAHIDSTVYIGDSVPTTLNVNGLDRLYTYPLPSSQSQKRISGVCKPATTFKLTRTVPSPSSGRHLA